MPKVSHAGQRARSSQALGLLLVLAGGMPAFAQSAPSNLFCAGLWYERNAIFRDAGYCFRTDRAIEAFGNDGCRYLAIEDVPLSRRQRAEVDRIRRWEREKGCTGN